MTNNTPRPDENPLDDREGQYEIPEGEILSADQRVYFTPSLIAALMRRKEQFYVALECEAKPGGGAVLSYGIYGGDEISEVPEDDQVIFLLGGDSE